MKPKFPAGLFAALISLLAYLITLAPGVTFWDSGELIYSAVTLGLAHPPAYPLFSMLGKGFWFLPIGSAAYRVNLLSAVFGAAAVYLVFVLVMNMSNGRAGERWVAAGASLSFAFYGSFWANSVITEVYTINSLLLAAILLSAFRYERSGREAYLHAGSFLLGLALVNHQSAVFLIPAYAVFGLLSKDNYKRPAVLIRTFFFLLLGLSVLLYLPVRAAAGPPINIGDPETLGGFKYVIKWEKHVEVLGVLFGKLLLRLRGPGLAAAALGLAGCAFAAYLLRKKPFFLMAGLSALVYFLGVQALTAGQEDVLMWGLQSKFYIPVVLFMVPLAAAAVFRLLEAAGGEGGVRSAAPAAVAVLLLSASAALFAKNYTEVDNSRNFFARDFAANALNSVRHDGALFGWGDNGVFPVWYLQGVERYRDDVFFMHGELLSLDWYMSQVRPGLNEKYGINFQPPYKLYLLRKNIGILMANLGNRAPVYFDYSAATKLKLDLDRLRPQGLIHMVPTGRPEPLGDIWGKYVLRGAFDGSTNPAFAAEGILEIYAYESLVWAREAYLAGRLEETIKAYELSKKLGTSSPELDDWIEGVRKEMEGRNKN